MDPIQPIELVVYCEAIGASGRYRVLAVGKYVDLVAVGDVILFNKESILHTLTPSKPKVFVRQGDILAKVTG